MASTFVGDTPLAEMSLGMNEGGGDGNGGPCSDELFPSSSGGGEGGGGDSTYSLGLSVALSNEFSEHSPSDRGLLKF